MSWQHMLIAGIYVVTILFSATLLGDTREYTKGYIVIQTVITAGLLALLIWGQ